VVYWGVFEVLPHHPQVLFEKVRHNEANNIVETYHLRSVEPGLASGLPQSLLAFCESTTYNVFSSTGFHLLPCSNLVRPTVFQHIVWFPKQDFEGKRKGASPKMLLNFQPFHGTIPSHALRVQQ
jgi:hypothetical protein